MIFVTVGTQVSFDRLVRSVDEWAARRNRRDVFAQIGPTSWRPSNVEFVQFMEPPEFRAKVTQARVVVAHAGMGSIITALELGKPILVMPRRGDLGEHRNDHQIATARHFLAQGRISVAFDERELEAKLDELDRLIAGERLSTHASPRLIQTLGEFIHQGALPILGRPDGVVYFGPIDDQSRWKAEKHKMLRHFGENLPVLAVDSLSSGWGMAELFGRCVRGMSLGRKQLGASQASEAHQVASSFARRIRNGCQRLGVRRPVIWANGEVDSALLALIPHVAVVQSAGSAQSEHVMPEAAITQHQGAGERLDLQIDRLVSGSRPQLPLLAAR